MVTTTNTAQQLRQQTTDSLRANATATANAAAALLGDQIRLIQLQAAATEIVGQVQRSNASYQGTQADAIALVERLDAQWRQDTNQTDPLVRQALRSDPDSNPSTYLLRKFQEQFPSHVEVFVTDRYGALLGSTNKTSDYYQADEGWWQDAWANSAGAVHIGEPELDESTNTLAINVAVPIRDDARRVVGVLRSTVDIQIVLEILQDAQQASGGRAEIVDLEGNYLFNPGQPETIGSPAGLPAGTDFATATSIETDTDLVSFGRIERTGGLNVLQELPWVTAVHTPTALALAPVAAVTRIEIIAGTAAVVLAGLLAFILARALTGQIRRIQEVFARIGIGDFAARVDVVSTDELGQVGQGMKRHARQHPDPHPES